MTAGKQEMAARTVSLRYGSEANVSLPLKEAMARLEADAFR